MVIDIICLIFAAYGFYLGFSKGIIKTVFTLISIVFGVIAAAKFSPMMTDFLESILNYHHGLMFIAGTLVVFGLTWLLIRILANSLEGILKTGNVNIINQAAGGAIMAFLLVSLFSVFVLFGERAHIIDDTTKKESLTYGVLEAMPDKLMGVSQKLKPVFKEFWEYSINFMDRIEKGGGVEKKSSDTIFDIDEDADSSKR
ncbi:MAG: CvpA family protein [Saprospiraceae bacterium]|nr:CvpA family protein [Saprospiraceae bacterium]MCB9326232.1 CvpA family protein [Lewinellaceae bacterium]